MSEKVMELFKSELKVINIGIEIFYNALLDQGIKAVHITWQPPPKLEKEYRDILSKIL